MKIKSALMRKYELTLRISLKASEIKIRLYAGSSLELHVPNYCRNAISGKVNGFWYGKNHVNWIIRREDFV